MKKFSLVASTNSHNTDLIADKVTRISMSNIFKFSLDVNQNGEARFTQISCWELKQNY